MSQLTTFTRYRARIAEEEPRCEQLRNENSALRAKMIATKEFQTAAVQEVEKLKAEKNSLIKRKASSSLLLSHIFLDRNHRKHLTARLTAFRTQSLEHGRELFNLPKESNAPSPP